MKQEQKEKLIYEIESLSKSLNRYIDMKEGIPLTKAFVPTNIGRGLKVCVETGDHLPMHLHIKDKNGNLLFRLQLDPVDLYMEAYDRKYLKYTIDFFNENINILENVRDYFKRYNPELNYDK